jgi:hypothetical protein
MYDATCYATILRQSNPSGRNESEIFIYHYLLCRLKASPTSESVNLGNYESKTLEATSIVNEGIDDPALFVGRVDRFCRE